MSVTLSQLAKSLNLDYQGDPDLVIENVASLESAKTGDLCFIQQSRYLSALSCSQCSAVIVPTDIASEVNDGAILISDNPHYSFIQAIELLGVADSPKKGNSIHPSAQIASSANLGTDISVGPLAVIEEGAVIGDGSRIGTAAVVGEGSKIGRNCILHARVVLYRSVTIGDRCELHAGVVIGSDGFGLVMHQQQWQKIPQLGSVEIGDDVEIGANTTVDRGALDDTIIEQGCKLDNQIQVAHNVRIGAHTAIAACVGIAGSANIGRHCKISGAAVVLGHLTVVDHVTVTAMSLVTKDIKESGVYSSGTPLLENRLWHRNNVRYKSLDKLAQKIAELEKKIDKS